MLFLNATGDVLAIASVASKIPGWPPVQARCS